MVRSFNAAICIALASMSACTSGQLGAARELGGVGVAASARLLTAATAVETGFSEGLRQDRFLRGLQTAGEGGAPGCYIAPVSGAVAPPAPRSEAPQATVDKVSAALRARTQLAASLGSTYAAWNRLAEYDAGTQVETGVKDVFSAVALLRETWELTPLPAAVGEITTAGAGALAGQAQVRRLKLASANLRRALTGYREGLEKGKRVTTSLMADEVGQKYALTIALWRRGYLDGDGFISRMAVADGLAAAPAQPSRRTASDEALCRAVRAYLEGARDERRRAVGDEYEAQIAVVGELIGLHEHFERGSGLDLVQLTVLLDRLTALAQSLGPKEEEEATHG